MNTYLVATACSTALIAIVAFLVHRDRRERDLDRRALIRALAAVDSSHVAVADKRLAPKPTRIADTYN